MTLEDVKNDLWSFTDWKIIMFLMAEIEKLKINLAMAEDATRKSDSTYYELKNAAIALVQRLELDKDVKKNNWWLNERAKIMEVIDSYDRS